MPAVWFIRCIEVCWRVHAYGDVGMSGIGHLLVVAGVPGAGKSTFIDQLNSGSLPSVIIEKLPGRAGAWPCLHNKHLHLLVPMVREIVSQVHLPRLVLHCDLTKRQFIKSLQGTAVQFDPFASIADLAEEITFVTIQPTSEQIIDQLVLRAAGYGLSRDEISRNGFLMMAIRLAKRKNFKWPYKKIKKTFPWIDWRKIDRRRRLWYRMRNYRTPGWIESVYHSWQTYLTIIMGENAASTHILIKPDTAMKNGPFNWSVVAVDSNSKRRPAAA